MARSKIKYILGGAALLGGGLWLSRASASPAMVPVPPGKPPLAPTVRTPKGDVQMSVKYKRGRRKVWSGTTGSPMKYGAHKYNPGDVVRVVDQPTDGRPMTFSTPRKVLSMIANELVEFPGGNTSNPVPVAGAPYTWTYTVEDETGPWEVAEGSLVKE